MARFQSQRQGILRPRARSEAEARQAYSLRITRFAKNPVEQDRNVRELVDAGTPVVAIFGKSWDHHVHRALGISLEENLLLISETVAYLKTHGKEVVYDAEHFFDGYIHNRDYALETLAAAKSAGADVLCSATPMAALSPNSSSAS